MSLILKACSILYGAVVGIRGWLYDRGLLRSYRSRIPVVSVGNITAGGNGKTPLCIMIARELGQRGVRVAILSRGYGGRERGPHRVASTDVAAQVGDEPLLMAQAGFQVYVSRSRVKGVRCIERDGTADVVLLDDGLQHRALERDLDIVSVFAGTEDAVRAFLRGELLPSGLFRESRRKALERASLVVFSHRTVLSGAGLPSVDERLLRVMPPGLAVFRSYLEAERVQWLVSEESLQPQEVIAFAAIANPEGFFASLQHIGFRVRKTFSYPDHYQFQKADLQAMCQEFPNLPLVCTEKDAVKLRSMESAIVARIAQLHVVARVVPADAFIAQILRRIQR